MASQSGKDGHTIAKIGKPIARGTSGREDYEMTSLSRRERNLRVLISIMILASAVSMLDGCHEDEEKSLKQRHDEDKRSMGEADRVRGSISYISDAVESDQNLVRSFGEYRDILAEHARKQLARMIREEWATLQEQPKETTDSQPAGPPPAVMPWGGVNVRSQTPVEQERRWEREIYIQILVWDGPPQVTVTVAVYTGKHRGHYVMRGKGATKLMEWLASMARKKAQD